MSPRKTRSRQKKNPASPPPLQKEQIVLRPRESTIRKNIFNQQQIIERLCDHYLAGPFLSPVNEKKDHAPNYYKVVEDPIDLQEIENRNKMGVYPTFAIFHKDV